MADHAPVTLRVGGTPVAEYRTGADLDPTLGPRPHLHPVRTLSGVPVTDTEPVDHPWHLGMSVALQDVDGWNFWGGPTYLRGQGYTWRDDHGRIDHVAFTGGGRTDGGDGFDERLHWVSPHGEQLLVEDRRVRGRLVEHGWELTVETTLTNDADRAVALGSPATNGRAGAGYGGLFWRLPPSENPHVRTEDAEGESAVHGSASPWLAWTDRTADYTLVLTGTDGATADDPWFVRVDDYPGIGLQLAATDPVTLPAGGTTTRGLRALIADGAVDDDSAHAWAAG